MSTLREATRELADADGRRREVDLERKVAQLERLQLLGRMAGGVAHDFNNLLTVILGYADLIALSLDEDHALQPAVTELRRAGERGAALTNQLLSLGRTRALRPEPFDLAEHVRGMEEFLRRLIPANVRLDVQASSAAWCHGDAVQMEQVIANLTVNARDAVSAGGYVRVLVSGDREFVRLTVSDSGSGMAPATLEHAFDPFFTTKGEGRGTGLGLPTVQSIAREHGGDVTIESTVGAGTSVVVSLPVADRIVASPDACAPRPVILVVDDDRTARRTVQVTLSRHGYVALPAANAQEAIAISAAHKGAIDLLVSDIVLPGLNGYDLAARLRTERPGLTAIFMSAHSSDEMRLALPRGKDQPFLVKPLSADTLLRAVDEALQELPAPCAAAARGVS